MTLTKPHPVFKVTVFLQSSISKTVLRLTDSYYSKYETILSISNGTMFGDLD